MHQSSGQCQSLVGEVLQGRVSREAPWEHRFRLGEQQRVLRGSGRVAAWLLADLLSEGPLGVLEARRVLLRVWGQWVLPEVSVRWGRRAVPRAARILMGQGPMEPGPLQQGWPRSSF